MKKKTQWAPVKTGVQTVKPGVIIEQTGAMTVVGYGTEGMSESLLGHTRTAIQKLPVGTNVLLQYVVYSQTMALWIGVPAVDNG